MISEKYADIDVYFSVMLLKTARSENPIFHNTFSVFFRKTKTKVSKLSYFCSFKLFFWQKMRVLYFLDTEDAHFNL